MKKNMNSFTTTNTVLAIILLALGLFLAIWPENSLNTIINLMSVLILVIGGIKLLNYYRYDKEYRNKIDLLEGIVFVFTSLMMFSFADNLISLLTMIFGCYVAFEGLSTLLKANELRTYELNNWKHFLIVGIVLLIIGCIFVFNSFKAITTIVRAMGIILVILGLKDLYLTYCINKIDSFMDK